MKENICLYSQIKRELKQEKKESLVYEKNGKEMYLLDFEYFGHYGFITNIGILDSQNMQNLLIPYSDSFSSFSTNYTFVHPSFIQLSWTGMLV